MVGTFRSGSSRFFSRLGPRSRRPKISRLAEFLRVREHSRSFGPTAPFLHEVFDAFGKFAAQVFRFGSIVGQVVKLPIPCTIVERHEFPVSLSYRRLDFVMPIERSLSGFDIFTLEKREHTGARSGRNARAGTVVRVSGAADLE
jgi:hypothetical protein